MAKIRAIVVVLAVALLAIVEVSAFRATITTSIDEEDQGEWGGGSQSQQRCRQQIQQRFQQLRQCQQYLQQQGSPFELPMNTHGQQEQQQLRQCCQQLKNFDEQCRCEAVRQIVERVLQEQGQYGQGQQGQQQQEQIVQKARYLPQTCNLQPQECQIQQQGYLY